uniref:Uncharacterized protein n=1 Tax=Plectus sambesii TaxID=2011161 RepID=A0A914UL68_9BILA
MANCSTTNETANETANVTAKETTNKMAQDIVYRHCASCSNFLADNETDFQQCSDNATCVGNVCYIVQTADGFPLKYFAGCLNTSISIDFGDQLGLCNVKENVSKCVCNSKDKCNNLYGTKGFLMSENGTFSGIEFNLTRKTFVIRDSQLANGELVPNQQNQRNVNGAGLDAIVVTPLAPIPNSAECYKPVKLTTAVALFLFAVLHLV